MIGFSASSLALAVPKRRVQELSNRLRPMFRRTLIAIIAKPANLRQILA